jgi:foldase protein PrsA
VRPATIVLLLLLAGCGGGGEKPLAVVDGKEIREAEFRERYLKFLEQGGMRDNIVARKQVLGNMVNEVLIHEDIRRLGLDRDEAAARRMEEIRTQAILDAYARRISVDTMTVSEPELQEEFRRSITRVNARYLYARSEDGARELRRRLEAGATFEELAREVFDDPGLASNGGSLGWFGWGEMEPALEQAAYALKVGELSPPVRLAVGWAVVRVDDRNRQPLASEYDFVKVRGKLDEAVRRRKTADLVRRAAEGAQAELAPRFNEETVRKVWERWPSLRGGPGTAFTPEAGAPAVEDLSALPMAEFGGRTWTVEEFVQRMKQTTDRQRRRVTSPEGVKEMATGLAVRQVLIGRARDAGLEEDPGVRRQVERVSEEYLLKRWAALVQDTVGRNGWPDQVLFAQYDRNRSLYAFPPEVNVQEVLVRTKQEAEEVRRLVDRGADFAALARKRSIRLWAANQEGELGFGTRSAFGVLGDRFMEAKPGTVIGPEFVDPYWGVFRVKEHRGGRLKTFDEAKPEIAEGLARAGKLQAFKTSVESLRAGADVAMDIDRLSTLIVQ